MGRAPSTICREVSANGGRSHYRALHAERDARRRVRRPKVAKLVRCRRLRLVVEAKLAKYWSPEEISAWLARIPRRPGDAGEPRDHLHVPVRPGSRGAAPGTAPMPAQRSSPAPTKSAHQGRFRPGADQISERPAEVEDRAVPGHWEGDLIFGRRMTTIGTLVERSTRYVMLFALPHGHTAEAVRTAMAKKIPSLPTELRRSLTWDQGPEMSEHAQFTIDTGVQVYFCLRHWWNPGTAPLGRSHPAQTRAVVATCSTACLAQVRTTAWRWVSSHYESAWFNGGSLVWFSHATSG
jgi:IS30 family transposase